MPGQPDFATPNPSKQPATPPRATNGSHHNGDKGHIAVDSQRYAVQRPSGQPNISPPHVPPPPWIATNPRPSTSSTSSSSISNNDAAAVKRKRKHGSADGPESPKDVIVFEVDPPQRTPSKQPQPPHRSVIPTFFTPARLPSSAPVDLARGEPDSSMAPVLPGIRDQRFLNNSNGHPRLPPPPSPVVGGRSTPTAPPADVERPSPSAPSRRKVKLLVKGLDGHND